MCTLFLMLEMILTNDLASRFNELSPNVIINRGRFPAELVAAFPQTPSGLFGFTENCSVFASSKAPLITFEEEEWEEQELASDCSSASLEAFPFELYRPWH
ncbi:hypothetical protein KSP39_PZI017584 [Platanthera zijinensis]|uniref:Uncharacterized protein n=1 Tax=Platanthera zijinensis TaxID=2320716 RepID=A0AAP0B4J1_9ASPA